MRERETCGFSVERGGKKPSSKVTSVDVGLRGGGGGVTTGDEAPACPRSLCGGQLGVLIVPGRAV